MHLQFILNYFTVLYNEKSSRVWSFWLGTSLLLSLQWFRAKSERVGMRNSTSESATMVLSMNMTGVFSCQIGREVLTQVKDFKLRRSTTTLDSTPLNNTDKCSSGKSTGKSVPPRLGTDSTQTHNYRKALLCLVVGF